MSGGLTQASSADSTMVSGCAWPSASFAGLRMTMMPSVLHWRGKQ